MDNNFILSVIYISHIYLNDTGGSSLTAEVFSLLLRPEAPLQTHDSPQHLLMKLVLQPLTQLLAQKHLQKTNAAVSVTTPSIVTSSVNTDAFVTMFLPT